MRYIVTAFAASLFVMSAAAEQCRMAATSWQEAGYAMRTEISSRADGECKLIKHSIDGVEERGLDCNCDLLMDGREGEYRVPPTYSQTPLLEVCFGPEADPEEYPASEWLNVVE
ncbi:MAG: hypothetical protein AAGJ85_04975 [Pseudomonadota bacterium]